MLMQLRVNVFPHMATYAGHGAAGEEGDQALACPLPGCADSRECRNHVLYACNQWGLARYQARHDAVVAKVIAFAEGRGYTSEEAGPAGVLPTARWQYATNGVPAGWGGALGDYGTHTRPDVVLYDALHRRKAVVIEVTVTAATRWGAAREEKTARYRPLCAAMTAMAVGTVEFCPLVLGGMGEVNLGEVTAFVKATARRSAAATATTKRTKQRATELALRLQCVAITHALSTVVAHRAAVEAVRGRRVRPRVG
jgi:hypothetical protein